MIPRELEDELYDKMVEYYKDNPNVTVIVDRREGPDRRSGPVEPEHLEKRQTRDRRRPRATQRGNVFVSSTTCWKVGRFWKGNGGTETPLALTQRFMSKQLACAFSAQAPWP